MTNLLKKVKKNPIFAMLIDIFMCMMYLLFILFLSLSLSLYQFLYIISAKSQIVTVKTIEVYSLFSQDNISV